MIIRLWALAWAARYLKYVPILGWRFSETIVQRIEDRMDRDVDVADVTVDLDASAPPTDCRVDLELANELPLDLTVTAVNVRLAHAEDADTIANVCWAEDAHGSEPRNVTTTLVESDGHGTITVERSVPTADAREELHVDGTLTTTAWLDVPSTKRIPLGDIECDLPHTTVDIDVEASTDVPAESPTNRSVESR